MAFVVCEAGEPEEDGRTFEPRCRREECRTKKKDETEDIQRL